MMLQEFIDRFGVYAWALTPLVIGAFILLRYIVIAGAALWMVTHFKDRLAARRIQPIPFTGAQLRREALCSVSTALVFAAIISAVMALDARFDVMKIYTEVERHGWLWFWLSIPTALLLHDFYFYWAHRFMHVPGIYERVHKTHHLSTNPSPLAALSFHPIEAALEILPFLLIAALLPMHPIALALAALFSLVINVMGHLGYELFPRSFSRQAVFVWVNTATSHNQHHRTFAYNFGLYTLIWDRLFGTVHPHYRTLYERVTAHGEGAAEPAPAASAARPVETDCVNSQRGTPIGPH